MAKERQKRRSGISKGTDADEAALRRYLDIVDEDSAIKGGLPGLMARLKDWRFRIHRRGRERITVMVVPHTESNIINLHISNYTLFGSIGLLAIFLSASLITIINRSAETIQFYDMGLTNSQFHIQSARLADEIIPLHERISVYTNTLASIYTRLNGKPEELPPRGGVAEQVVEKEIEDLNRLISECKKAGETCEQSRIEGILRRSLYLSILDNEKLKKAIEISNRVIKDLNSTEKQHILKMTPNIWPVNGAIAVPYGDRFDVERGNGEALRGVWFQTNPGAEVLSTAPGKIAEINYQPRFGLYIWVEHPVGVRTFYAHLDRVAVNVGDNVDKGQVIGYAGRSGGAPSNMLYYEIHIGTVAYNPHAFLNHLQSLWLKPQNP